MSVIARSLVKGAVLRPHPMNTLLWDTICTVRVLVDDDGTEADVPLSHPGMLIRLKSLLVERQIVIRTIRRADCPRCAQ